MTTGESKVLIIEPHKAYGDRTEVFEEIPKSDLQSFVDAGFRLEI